MNVEGDVVLIHLQEHPTMYARIEAIEPDIKKDWYHVTLLLLTIPPQNVTWILREEYFNGTPFTMGGNAMRIEEVKPVYPPHEQDEGDEISGGKDKSKPGKVIPFKNLSK